MSHLSFGHDQAMFHRATAGVADISSWNMARVTRIDVRHPTLAHLPPRTRVCPDPRFSSPLHVLLFPPVFAIVLFAMISICLIVPQLAI